MAFLSVCTNNHNVAQISPSQRPRWQLIQITWGWWLTAKAPSQTVDCPPRPIFLAITT